MMTTTTTSDDNSQLEGVPDFIKEKLLEMKTNIDQVERIFTQIDAQFVRDLTSKLTPLEHAKFNWINLYSINSLFFVYLKNNGVALKEHSIMTELNRIKAYLSRINEISAKEEENGGDSNKNKLKLDKESSARIIKRSLWANAKKGSNSNKTQVSEMINATLENATVKRRDEDDDDDDDESDHVDKKLKTN